MPADDHLAGRMSLVCAILIGTLTLLLNPPPAFAATCLIPLSFSETDPAHVSFRPSQDAQVLSDGHILLLLAPVLYDLAPSTTNAQKVDTTFAKGEVRAIGALDSGRALIVTLTGLFWFAPGNHRSAQIASFKPTASWPVITKLEDGRTLVGAGDGLFQIMAGGGEAIQIKSAVDIGTVSEIVAVRGGDALVGTTKGLFRVSSAGEILASFPTDGPIGQIKQLSDGWLSFLTQKGLYIVAPKGHSPVLAPSSFNPLFTEEQVVIADSHNVFVSDGTSEFVPVPASDDLDQVYSALLLPDKTILVSATRGLFAMPPHSNQLSLVVPYVEMGLAPLIFPLGDGRILIPTLNQLKILDHDLRTLIVLPSTTRRIGILTVMPIEDGRTVITTGNGGGAFLLAKDGTSLQTLGLAENTSTPEAIYIDNGRVLVSVGNKVLIVSPNIDKVAEIQQDDVTGRAEHLHLFNVRGTGAFAITDNGVIRLAPAATRFDVVGDKFVAAQLLSGQRNIYHLDVSSVAGSLLVTPTFVTRMAMDDTRTATVDYQPRSVFPIDELVVISATVHTGLCERELQLWQPRLRVLGPGRHPDKAEFATPRGVDGNLLTFGYRFPERGVYQVQVELPLADGGVGGGTELRAGTTMDIAENWAKIGGPSLILFHALVVACLAFGARRSGTCFRLLVDPVWGKSSIYFNALLRHWPALQVWLLTRYLLAAGAEVCRAPDEPYDPLPLAGPPVETVADAGIFTLLRQHRHIWLQGHPGMGKSSTVRALERAFFCSDERARNPFTARRRWGGIFLFIPARLYESIASDPLAPESWLVRVASERLTQFGLAFPDLTTVRAMLESGTLALVLDGVNEVGKDEQVIAFAVRYRETTILVTSQTEAPQPFLGYRLPEDISDYVGKVLRVHLGSDVGESLEHCLRAECPDLLCNLKSGYDVRLVVDLVRRLMGSEELSLKPPAIDSAVLSVVKQLPSTRIGLYDAILAATGKAYPIEELGEIAWKMWLAGERVLPHDDAVLARLIRPLDKENVSIVRRISNDTLEFRHDQMRAYLAALWLVRQAANAETLTVHLVQPEVWRVAARDQEELWPFVAALLPSALLPNIGNFALAAPERIRLYAAVQQEASNRNMQFVLTATIEKGGPSPTS